MFTKQVRVGTGVTSKVAPIYKEVIDWETVWNWVLAIVVLLAVASCYGG